jgi:hypothetical protein
MSIPHTFILFRYSPFDGTQLYINASYKEEHLIEIVNSHTDSSDYYAIYKYDSIQFVLGNKALQYSLHKKLAGKKNSKVFPYSPMEYALKFDTHDWLYKSH